MKLRAWTLVTGVIALAGLATGFLVTVQTLGPHGRRPRYGAGRHPSDSH
jgi:hypothetical protein